MNKKEEISTLIHEMILIVGEKNVIWKKEDLIVYEYDASIGKSIPSLVVVPKSSFEISECVKIANKFNRYIVARGAATGLSGGALPLKDSIVISLTKLNKIIEIDEINHIAVVEPGVVNITLSEIVKDKGLFYAPDPASQKTCTIGGNISENSGGPHCFSLGVTTNHTLGLEVVLSNGEIVWLGGKSRSFNGYDTRGAFIGSEGTFGIVTKIIVRLLKIPESVQTILASYQNINAASKTVSEIIASGMIPSALEMMDRLTIKACELVYKPNYPENSEAVLIVEVDGLKEDVDEKIKQIIKICKKNKTTEIRQANNDSERNKLWETRKGAIGAYGTIAPAYYLIDGVVPRTKIAEVLEKIDQISAELNVTIANVFHAGDGNIHPAILFDSRKTDEVNKAIQAGEKILEICVSVGGTLSGEHGIGTEKQAYMPLVFNENDLEAMKKLRKAFVCLNPYDDPEKFNPGKIFPKEVLDDKSYGLKNPEFYPTGTKEWA